MICSPLQNTIVFGIANITKTMVPWCSVKNIFSRNQKCDYILTSCFFVKLLSAISAIFCRFVELVVVALSALNLCGAINCCYHHNMDAQCFQHFYHISDFHNLKHGTLF